MKGPPRVGTASATAATVYTENLGEVANTSYGAIASLPIVPDVPSATATTSGPPEVGRLVGRAPLSRLGRVSEVGGPGEDGGEDEAAAVGQGVLVVPGGQGPP